MTKLGGALNQPQEVLPLFGGIPLNYLIVTLLPIIREKVLEKSTVYTDELPSYDRLPTLGYVHRRVHHASKVYVSGDAHTNTVEGFWSLVKRGISGVNHAVSAKYLQNYLNEYVFRYNRRQQEEPMFESFLTQVVISGRGA